jgi:sulfur carrier protein
MRRWRGRAPGENQLQMGGAPRIPPIDAPASRHTSVKLAPRPIVAAAMQIVVNGEPHEAPELSSVATLLAQLRLLEQRLAVELNGEIVPRSVWAEQRLNAADRIEIVRAIGGG